MDRYRQLYLFYVSEINNIQFNKIPTEGTKEKAIQINNIIYNIIIYLYIYIFMFVSKTSGINSPCFFFQKHDII